MKYGGVPGDEVWSGQPQKTYTSETKIRKSFQCYFYQSAKTGKGLVKYFMFQPCVLAAICTYVPYYYMEGKFDRGKFWRIDSF